MTNNLATIQSEFKVIGLESQKTYLLGAYLNTTVGNSYIKYEVFRTKRSSNGAGLKLSLTGIVDSNLVIQFFSQVLRIAP